MNRQADRRVGAPNKPRTGPPKQPRTTIRRRVRIVSRRNRRLVPRRNRLERAQNNQNRNGRLRNRRFRRFNLFNRRRNFQRRVIFVGGLPNRITNKGLYQLFRPEGRILSYRVLRNRNGFTRGFGFVEFVRPRDAWRSIQKWNNSTLDRNIIKVAYRRRRNFNRRRFGNNNFNNRNNGRFNQSGRGFGFRGGRGGNRGGFRTRRGF